MAVRVVCDVANDKLTEAERTLTFYFKEVGMERIIHFFQEETDMFQGVKLNRIELDRMFINEKSAHEYYLEEWEKEGFQSWPILLLDDRTDSPET